MNTKLTFCEKARLLDRLLARRTEEIANQKGEVMEVTISKKEFIKTIKEPAFSVMTSVIDRGLGDWTGGFVDEWDWYEEELMKLTDDELISLKEEMKDSWKFLYE